MAASRSMHIVASHSFTSDQVRLYNQIMTTMIRGGDVRDLARNESFSKLLSKGQAMTKTSQRLEAATGDKG